MDIASPPASRSNPSLLMSAAALVLSAVALTNSLSPRGQGLARELPVEKRLSTSREYVTLEQLAIYQDQIADAAIGTLELQDGAVTSAKLAGAAVTADKLADAAVTVEKLDGAVVTELAKQVGGNTGFIVGEADDDGTLLRGTGFTVSRVGTGEYTLNFETPFSARPIVLAVAQSYGKCSLPSQHVRPGSVRVKCMSDLLGSTPVPANTRFSFVAHGDA